METVYGTPPEEVDEKAPIPNGKMVQTTLFVDADLMLADLMHNMVMGRSCTGILKFMNQTPVACQATERNLRYTLLLFGAPLDGPMWMFGDNKPVVTSLTIPHATLGEHWNALSYHCIHKAVAGSWLKVEHIPGTENPV